MQQEGHVSTGKAGRRGGARVLRRALFAAWGRRSRRTIRLLDGGGETVDERRAYDRYGRLVEIAASGTTVRYAYDARGRLLAVREDGADVERYAYDRAGNMVRKTVRGKTTAFTFDGANQLVSSTTGGVTTRYAYDAAGRLVREGAKTYRYGWLDKVLSVTDGARTYRYDWHADGQLARADYGDGTSESFLWDGLALVRRGGEDFVNEPHAGGGSPVASSKGAVYFNDLLGTTVGVREGRGPLRAKQGDKAPRYTAAALTAFGEPLPGQGAGAPASGAFFTGKPSVPGLGYAFLLRSDRPDLAKWQTADPLGYPDGWNPLVYCGNAVLNSVDIMGGYTREVQDPSYPQTRSVRLSDWIYHHTSWDTKWYYSWWETYTETRYIIYEVTTTSTLMDYVHNGLTFTAIVGSVVVSIAVAAPGGQPVAVIGGIVTSVAALGAWLTEHESDQTEIVKGDRIEKSNVVREKRWKSVKIE